MIIDRGETSARAQMFRVLAATFEKRPELFFKINFVFIKRKIA